MATSPSPPVCADSTAVGTGQTCIPHGGEHRDNHSQRTAPKTREIVDGGDSLRSFHSGNLIFKLIVSSAGIAANSQKIAFRARSVVKTNKFRSLFRGVCRTNDGDFPSDFSIPHGLWQNVYFPKNKALKIREITEFYGRNFNE
jgi:hypothetical protein